MSNSQNELNELREEVSKLADEARDGADGMSLEQAKASKHGQADAYEHVTQLIDKRLYGDE